MTDILAPEDIEINDIVLSKINVKITYSINHKKSKI